MNGIVEFSSKIVVTIAKW